jgi:uroporphyrin-III C-methyltransferase
MAQSLIFVTAHARAEAKLELDWPSLGMSNATLAVYMGRSAAQEIAQNLIAGGRRPGTPVIVAANVSLASERWIRGRWHPCRFSCVGSATMILRYCLSGMP